MKRLARLSGKVNLKAESAESTDLPTRFDILAYTGGKLDVDGFDLPVVIDLNGLEAEGEIPIPIKHNTDDEMILGQTDSDGIKNSGTDLWLSGPVTADPEQSPSVKRVLTMGKNGHTWQASVGAKVEESYDVAAGVTIEVNGQSLTGPFTHATRSVLRETSVLGMGADKNTRVILAQQKGQIMSFEEWLLSVMGLDASTLNDAARSVFMEQYEAQQGGGEDTEVEAEDDPEDKDKVEAEDDPEDKVEAEGDTEPEDKKPPVQAKAKGKGTVKAKPKAKATVKAAAKGKSTVFNPNASAAIQAARRDFSAEMKRIGGIQAICGGNKMFAAAAVENGWSLDKTELEWMKKQQRLNIPNANRSDGQSQGMLHALQGAMIMRAGGRIDYPGYGGHLGLALGLPSWLRAGINADARQKAMEAAWKYRDMSMVDLCKAACQIDGRDTDGSNQGFIRAAVSGGALTDIFTTNINAVFIQKFVELGDSTVGWTKDAEANNFQPMERTRLTKGPRLTQHARGGEADHAKRDDAMETYKIFRYSQQFAVDEMDMIDDRFKALADIPDEMAQACARMRPDLVYSILLSNPNLTTTGGALFSASQPGSQGNLVASGAALALATLQAALAAMFNLTENGVNIGLYPSHLLVPAVLEGTAYTILQSQNIAMAGTSGSVDVRGDVNPLAAIQSKKGKIEVVTDPRLTNGVIDPVTGTTYAGSTSTWRLASNMGPGIEVAYLRGSGKAPQVRQFIMDRGKWGVGWDVNLDIGAKALAWQTLSEQRQ